MGAKFRKIQPHHVGMDADEYMFRCPGCGCAHWVRTRGPSPVWSWNGNLDAPTISPSLLVRAPMHVPPVTFENRDEYRRNPWPQKLIDSVCHSFIRGGKIQFLADCTHELAGQTVEIPDWGAAYD